MTIEDIIAALAVNDNTPEKPAEAAANPQQAPALQDEPVMDPPAAPVAQEAFIERAECEDDFQTEEDKDRYERHDREQHEDGCKRKKGCCEYEYIAICKRRFIEPEMKVTKCYPRHEKYQYCCYMPCKYGKYPWKPEHKDER